MNARTVAIEADVGRGVGWRSRLRDRGRDREGSRAGTDSVRPGMMVLVDVMLLAVSNAFSVTPFLTAMPIK